MDSKIKVCCCSLAGTGKCCDAPLKPGPPVATTDHTS